MNEPAKSKIDDTRIYNLLTSLKSKIDDTQIYNLLTSLVMHSEHVRWTRLNTFLVVASIFLAAWAGIFAGTDDFPYKDYLLFALCIPGIFLGILWAVLGWRSSQYMDDFHDSAHKMEEAFDGMLPKPLHLSEKRRKGVRKSMSRYTSSKWLVTAVPLIFTALFLSLVIASFQLSKVDSTKSETISKDKMLEQDQIEKPNQGVQGTAQKARRP